MRFSTTEEALGDIEEWLGVEELRPLYVQECHVTSVYSLKRRAEEMGISFNAAAIMRKRFLFTELGKEETPPDDMLDEIQALDAAIKSQNDPVHKNVVTAEMKERAKEFPVDQLIQFTHGKAKCFAHEDRAPSMYFAFRTNKARCPVCDKGWDAIQILIDRDGLTFTRAVQQLCGIN